MAKTEQYVVTLSEELLDWAIPHLNGPDYCRRNQFSDLKQHNWHALVTVLSHARPVTRVEVTADQPRTYIETTD